MDFITSFLNLIISPFKVFHPVMVLILALFIIWAVSSIFWRLFHR